MVGCLRQRRLRCRNVGRRRIRRHMRSEMVLRRCDMERVDGRLGGGSLGRYGSGSARLERVLERVYVAGEHERYPKR